MTMMQDLKNCSNGRGLVQSQLKSPQSEGVLCFKNNVIESLEPVSFSCCLILIVKNESNQFPKSSTAPERLILMTIKTLREACHTCAF